MLDSLYDLEGVSTQIVMTVGGNEIEMPISDELRKTLRCLWDSLGIRDIEADTTFPTSM